LKEKGVELARRNSILRIGIAEDPQVCMPQLFDHLEYDVVVAGLGGMGSAALAHCAARGARVLGIEQFGADHDLGASSGKTRIIRQAYYEDAAYVPMLLRAYELWHELERTTGEEVMRLVGLLMAGTEQSAVISGAMRSARRHDLRVEYLTNADLRKRYPQLRVREGETGVFEGSAGALFPERAIRAHLSVARERGAQAIFNTEMARWRSDAHGVVIECSPGGTVRAKTLVLTLGPWFAAEMRDAGVSFEVQRNVQAWFQPSTDAYEPDRFPAFLIERSGLPGPLYGFPDFGDGVKAAFHGVGETVAAAAVRRDIDPQLDVAPIAKAVEEWMPGAAARYREGKACMYALTADRHFVIDRHPNDPHVILCGGFSGHGFKFAALVGEIAAQLALDGGTTHDIGFLSLGRFAK
jgi:sarcosine oxidase